MLTVHCTEWQHQTNSHAPMFLRNKIERFESVHTSFGRRMGVQKGKPIGIGTEPESFWTTKSNRRIHRDSPGETEANPLTGCASV
jgi:hypothetical protein